MKEQSPEDIKTERDALMSVVQASQDRAALLDRTIELLLLAGHVSKERVEQAMRLAAK